MNFGESVGLDHEFKECLYVVVDVNTWKVG